MLQVERLSKNYSSAPGSGAGIQGIDFHVQRGEFFTLLGPSGCGKTTTLRCVAGLEQPDSGRIAIAGQTVFSDRDDIAIPVTRRNVGMVFQSYAIWPHMTVFENVAFPLRAQRTPAREIRERVNKALELVGMESMEQRLAPLLSGGQQQRVALARAIVREAPLLLLDEPLSNLDAKLREQMRAELRDLQRRIGTTAIYVTHDQEEALSLSDRIAVMHAGKVVELGTPAQLYYQPRTAFTARFLGQTELLPCTVLERRPDGLLLDTPLGTFISATYPEQLGTRLGLMVRPEHFELIDAPEGHANVISGVVNRIVFAGRYVEYLVQMLTGGTLRVQCSSARQVSEGSHVQLNIRPERCVVVNDPD